MAFIASRLLHSSGPALPYPAVAMDPFEAYWRELDQSDGNPKTRARYWQIVCGYRAWLAGRPPEPASARGHLACLR